MRFLLALAALIAALPAAAENVVLGAATFRDHCAGCHGEDAMGTGPMTEILMPVFGAIFEGDAIPAEAPDGTPVIASARILALLDYLQSIQAETE
jgi:mono/diheme cytochrome c family protein